MIRFFILLLLAGFILGAHAQTPSLVKDIVPGNRGLGYRLNQSEAETQQFLITGNAFYFYSIDPLGKIGFWRSNGTSTGTYPLLEAAYSRELATAISDFQMNIPAVALGKDVYFVWQDAEQRPGIWKATDSSVAQAPMPEETAGKLPRNLTAVQGGFFFSTDNLLWKSDGTAAGTVKLKEFTYPGEPLEHVTPLGDAIYFLAYDEAGSGIWKTDGSPEGTMFVHETSFTWLIPYKNDLYFPTPDMQAGGSMGQALWKLETTTDAVSKMGSFETGMGTSYPHNFTRAAGKLFFQAHAKTDTIALHVTDGTAQGTHSLPEQNVMGMIGFRDHLYFGQDKSTQLKTTRGIPGEQAGTVEFGGIYRGFLHATDTVLFFTAIEEGYGTELWRTNGTTAGTYRISDIHQGPYHTAFGAAFIFKEELYFLANDGVHGQEIWKLSQPANQITGRAFLDVNKNGLPDAGEGGLKNQQIQIQPGNTVVYTNNAGLFSIAAAPGTYNVTLLPAEDWAISSGQSSYTLPVPSAEQALFGVYLANERRELGLNLTPASSSRCSVVVPYWLQLTNKGNIHASGQLQLSLDSQTELIDVIPAPGSSEEGVLIWNFENLPPTQVQTIQLYLKMPDFTAMGDTLRFYSQATLTGSEGIARDTLEQVLLCSYDPNDKLVKPAGINEEHFTLKNSWLDYTIRFQNTGNAEAIRVVLRDTLDHQLDLASFELLGSSHSMQLSRNERALEFMFEDIMLPDSTSNEPESHGFVRYRIRAQTGVAENTVIENTAHIFFDLNPAIVTNTTFNTLVSQLPERVVNGLPKGDTPGLALYPNPTDGQLTLTSSTPFMRLRLRTAMGQQVYEHSLPAASTSCTFSVEKLPPGLYLLELETGKQLLRKRLLKN